MADIELVIKISEELYQLCRSYADCIESAIANGTPLPKGHGRLIDADMLWDLYHDNDYDFYEAFDDVQTIIEADKAESEDEE